MSSGAGFLIILFTAFSFHVILFGIEVILSLIIVAQLTYSYLTNNEFFRAESKKFMNYIAVTYASSHFFLTAVTVMALTFFPDFLIIAGQMLFYPLGFIIAILILRLLMISYFWYGWDRFSPRYHLLAGIVFALAGVVWVYLYTVLLAFMNNTVGLIQIDPLIVDHALLFVNPTLLPLLLTIVFGAISATTTFLILYYSQILSNQRKTETEATYQLSLLKYHSYIGLGTAAAFILSLIWYLYSLKVHSFYKYNNWLGHIFGRTTSGIDLSWLFITFIVFAAMLVVVWILSVITVHNLELNETSNLLTKHRHLALLAPLTAIVFELFILLNFLSQTPYFFISKFNTEVVGMQVEGAFNVYADVIDMYSLTIFGFIPLITAFFALLYFFFTGKMTPEYPEKAHR